MANELMTGFLNNGANPLSVISTASMGDLGYVVNYAASDAYTVVNPLAALRASGGAGIVMHDDIMHLPIFVVDRSGRVVATIPPR
jgi:ureidoglycolate hydrolase